MFRSSCTALALLAAVVTPAIRAADPPLDTAAIESITGIKGTMNNAENVFKVSKPRTDIKASVDRWTLPPVMGITSYAAFMPVVGGTMVMGDTVLLEDEVNPAMSAALDAGLEVTALHNHVVFDQPKIYFMHIGGMGDTPRMARAVKAVYDRIAQVRSGQATPASAFPGDIPATSSISAAPIEDVFGAKSQSSNGMVKVVIGRKTTMHGVDVGNEMGVNTWAAFAGSDDNAVVDGDFAMLESELQPVLKALRDAGINIVAIHQHMTMESPRVMFLHYWGVGPTRALATGLKAALATQQH